MKADPNCPRCKGKGWVLVQIFEFDFEKDVCDCVEGAEAKGIDLTK